MSSVSSNDIKAEALRLGFFACGIAQAGPVSEETAHVYRQWISKGHQANMHYLEANLEKRLDPTLLLEGAKSIISVALNYTPSRRLPEDSYQIAAYAYGRDYHEVVKERLFQLAALLPGEQKVATDTVPILERYWAVQAGLGFIGRNRQLIIPGAGSQFFLGEIITTASFDHYDAPSSRHCPDGCHRCIDACPTGALSTEFLAEKCLSYQTIENRNALSAEAAEKMGTTIYGCDRCTLACPFNAHAPATDIADFFPSDALLQMTPDDWRHLTPEQYQQLFKGSAVKRAKYAGLIRNIKALTR